MIKKKKTKKKLSKTPIFKSELIILKRAIDLTFCQTPQHEAVLEFLE